MLLGGDFLRVGLVGFRCLLSGCVGVALLLCLLVYVCFVAGCGVLCFIVACVDLFYFMI